MRNQSYTYYNLHLIISRFGNKLTSMVLVFYFMNLFPDKSLFLTVLLFSISNLPSIILTEFYARIIKNINSFKELIFLDLIAGFLIIGIFFSLNNIFFLFLSFEEPHLFRIPDMVHRFFQGMVLYFYIPGTPDMQEICHVARI